MFETFAHTADLGLRVRAPELTAVFEDAAQGFLAVLIDNPEEVAAVEEREIAIQGVAGKVDDLLFDWLNELLYLFETDRMLFCDFDITVDEAGLKATARGERFDPSRHHAAHEIKAITYHGLKVAQEEGGDWLAEVIVDI